jgi:hypothetical protein
MLGNRAWQNLHTFTQRTLELSAGRPWGSKIDTCLQKLGAPQQYQEPGQRVDVSLNVLQQLAE